MNRQELIEQEYKRQCDIFSNIPEEKRDAIEPLLQNASFMKITLDELKEYIASKNIEDVQQELKLYNMYFTNYSTMMNRLIKMIPKNDKVKAESKLSNFCK